MAGLLDLPSELIASIFHFLEDVDFFGARFVCRYVETSSLPCFGRRYFRKKGYLITTASINVLKSIAAHGELRKYVQHVWFNPDCYTYNEPEHSLKAMTAEMEEDGKIDFDISLLPDGVQQQCEAYEECMKDHNQLLSGDKLGVELTTAFKSLPNLVVIGMRRSEDHKPWGWSKLKEAVGQDPRVLGPIPSTATHWLAAPTKLFVAIVSSAAAANVRLKRLYTDAIELDNIQPHLLPQHLLDKAWRALLYLEINAIHSWGNKAPDHSDFKITHEEEYGDAMVKVLKAVPHLRELGLQIFPDWRRSYMNNRINPFSWRRVYPYLAFQKVATNTKLDHLTRLKLEKITTSPETLTAFLHPSQRCLESLKMRDTRLLSSENYNRPWQTVFEFLRVSCTNLSYLLLYHLMYETGGISFVENPPTPIPYLESQDMNGAPNPPHGEPAGGEFFTEYDYIALEASGRSEVENKLDEIVDRHWYHKPIFSYAMDDELWHTDTSDEEW